MKVLYITGILFAYLSLIHDSVCTGRHLRRDSLTDATGICIKLWTCHAFTYMHGYLQHYLNSRRIYHSRRGCSIYIYAVVHACTGTCTGVGFPSFSVALCTADARPCIECQIFSRAPPTGNILVFPGPCDECRDLRLYTTHLNGSIPSSLSKLTGLT
jgi:hypothetical protein